MEVKPLEVYAEDSNYAVIKPPGRNFPGCVIQGDSLSILCDLAKRVAEGAMKENIKDPELLGDLEELLHTLLGRLKHYQTVLQKHGISLPYTRLITENDFINLAPESEQTPPPV